MRGLSSQPGIAAAVLTGAIGAWWLSSLALLPPVPTPATAELSVRATEFCITGQWIMIALLGPLWLARSEPGAEPVILASACLPLWPLLVMLWAASGIPALALVGAQLGAAALYALVLLGRGALSRLPVSTAVSGQLAVAAGAVLAAVIWAARSPLAGWMHP